MPHNTVCGYDGGGNEPIAVANHAGVFLRDGLCVWRNATANLPKVMVVEVMFHAGDRTLIAATYGRSIWRLRL